MACIVWFLCLIYGFMILVWFIIYSLCPVVLSLRKRMAETELSKSMNDFLTKLQDDLKEAMNSMMCTRCNGKHRCVRAA